MNLKKLTVLKALTNALLAMIEQFYLEECQTPPAPPPVGSHMIYSWTNAGTHYRIANDASWCTCKGFTYRQYCKHTRRPSSNAQVYIRLA